MRQTVTFERSRAVDLVIQYIRIPADWWWETDTDQAEFTFDPPLTAQEETALALIRAVVKSGMAHLTPAEFQTVRTNLATLRDFRQLGRNAFMALTAAERDRLLYDAQTATTIVLLAILRD